VRERSVFLSYGERWALRSMTEHFDDGLVGYKQDGDWEKTFDKMAERLSLRPRDPFGDSASKHRREGGEGAQQVSEDIRDGCQWGLSGNQQMRSDAKRIGDALKRDGKPENLP
jgi:hypothetical protein